MLDLDIARCARYHADTHVVKMILEGTQMLCTVLNRSGVPSPYRSTHVNHPCTVWTGDSLSNWLWLRRLVGRLNSEYRYRYGRQTEHESAGIASSLPLPAIRDNGLTDFAQAMPEEYRVPGDPVRAYRSYYVAEKGHLATWTRRRRPSWFVEGPRGIRGAAED